MTDHPENPAHGRPSDDRRDHGDADLGAALRSLAVPDHRSDFWTELEADMKADRLPVAPVHEIGSRGRGYRQLLVAAAAITVLGGTFGAFTAWSNRSDTIDTSGIIGTNDTNLDDTTADDETLANEESTAGSTDAPRSIGPGRLLAVLADGRVIVERTVDGTEGQGCEGLDPLRRIIDAETGEPLGEAHGGRLQVAPEPGGDVVLLSTCDGFTEVVGIGVPGLPLTEIAVPSPPLSFVGPPVWALDGSSFTLSARTIGDDSTLVAATFTRSGTLSTTEAIDGIVISRLGDDLDIVDDAGTVTVDGVEVLTGGDPSVPVVAARSADGSRVAVSNSNETVILGRDGVEQRIDIAGATLFAPAWSTGGRLAVADGSGVAVVAGSTIVPVALPAATTATGVEWISEDLIAVDVTDEAGNHQVWEVPVPPR